MMMIYTIYNIISFYISFALTFTPIPRPLLLNSCEDIRYLKMINHKLAGNIFTSDKAG